jgi:citrate synthase
MFADLYKNIKNREDEKEVKTYIQKILDKQVFDKQGLVYGMGHAVYTLSDPREVVLKEYAKKLAEEKGRLDDFNFYERVEKIAGKLIMQQKNVHKEVCANVDFYSGLVYSMMGIPEELYTPIFAIARISGWCAHRLEEILNAGKIVRPAYKYVGTHVPYVPINKR